MIRYGVTVLIALLLSACSSCPAVQPPITVEVPVLVPCIKNYPALPVFAVDQLKVTDSLTVITDAYMVERHQRIIHQARLEAALAGCIQ